MDRRYTLSDLHGNYKALMQVFDMANFDYEKDTLIVVGDVVDGYSQTKELIEELLKIKNLVVIKGNHDEMMLDFIKTGEAANMWLQQGGWETLKSYDKTLGEIPRGHFADSNDELNPSIIPKNHVKLLADAYPYYELDGMLFVHGGFDYPKHPSEHDIYHLTWDRELLWRCKNDLKMREWKKVFLGHTTSEQDGAKPIIMDFWDDAATVVQLDCGAGWKGRLCLFNIDTNDYFLSDYAHELNEEDGR